MSTKSTVMGSGVVAAKVARRTLVIGLLLVVLVIAWYVAFYLPQTHKYSSLQAARTSLETTVAQDDARLAQVRTESKHVKAIDHMIAGYKADAPASAQIYTYVKTISGAANATGVTITSLQPGALTADSGSSYSTIPITAAVKGSYAQLRAFLRSLYALPRLTAINGFSLSGGGPGNAPGKTLSASFQLSIFTSQKPSASHRG